VTYEELINDAREARDLGDADLELSILEKADALKAQAQPQQESKAAQLWKGVQTSLKGAGIGLAQRGTDFLSMPISADGKPLTDIKGRDELKTLAQEHKQQASNLKGFGAAGKFIGDVATFAALPGGPIVSGVMGGALTPSASEQETALNALVGGAGGAIGFGVGKGAGYLFGKYRPKNAEKAALFEFAEKNRIPLTVGQMRSTPGAPNATLLQRAEKQLAGLPGSSSWYAKKSTEAQKGVNETVNRLIGGNVDDLYRQVGEGRGVKIDQQLLDDLSAITKKYKNMPVVDQPGTAYATVRDLVGREMPNPDLAKLDPMMAEMAVKYGGIPRNVNVPGKLTVDDIIPLTGERGDTNSINFMRSYYGQKSYNAADALDEFAYKDIQKALDAATERSNPDIAEALRDVRGSYQIERMLARAKDTQGNYDPKKVASIIRKVQAESPKELSRISKGRGEELKNLAQLSDYLNFANSSGTAENQLVRDLLTGGLLGGSTYIATGDPKTAATAALGLYALPWLANRAIQANARGLLGGALDIQNPTIANLLKRSAGAIPAAGLLSATQ
jgi:hypothetical protein